MSRALFENMSDELRNLSREMSAIEEFKGNVKDVEEVIENINSPLTIMVMGEFSTGKSTFINALMGEAITKVDAKPTTAVITKLVYGERDRIVVHYQDGSAKEYGREEFERLTAEADAQSNEMHERMDYVERTLPIDMLKSMSIIDSPGLNSIKSVHEDMTRHFMDKADTVLWMFDANKPGSQTEIDALKRLNPRLTPLVLVNKIDGIDEEEGDSVEGILEGVERRLENNKIEAQGYLGISAKMAFKGRTENRDKLVQASNIGAFYDAIEEKVLPGREQYKRNSLLDGLVKMIYGAGSQIKELRQKNEERKSSDYAAYVAMETELAAVWDELENIADIMLTDIENNQTQGRKRLNAAMKSFYGMLHWLGIFVEQDDEAARKYLEEAAVRGDEAAQIVLAECLWRKGEEEKAKYWIERVGIDNLLIKDRKDVLTHACYLQTHGMKLQSENSGEGKKQSINRNMSIKSAVYKIGRDCICCGACATVCPVDVISNGLGKYEIDPEGCIECGACAVVCPTHAIDIQEGDVVAKEKLAKGVKMFEKRQYGDALICFREAAGAGKADAMAWLGKMYAEGKGVGQDYKEAMQWYIKAADMGNGDAMNRIGVMYWVGRGVGKDYTYARNWFQKAINVGNDYAKKNLESLEEGLRYAELRNARGSRKRKDSGCFITTATCDNFGKSDNCYELNTFRTFRDNWLSCQPDGPALISEYYDVAPAIVEKIDSLSNAKEVYVNIWDKYLSKCLSCIEQGDNYKCKEIYVNMVRVLQKRFS